ncbi:MAG TPA: EAL domain-containing response regulator, partial [Beijerinckiaceae bacterium]
MNGTLLVVDDDFVQRAIIQKLAAKAGFETVVASSYEQASALLSSRPFDLMTLDLSLGERDGVEVLRLLARLGLAAMPVVVISGCEERILNSTRRVAETLGLALRACLAKPLDFARLREALTERAAFHVGAAGGAPLPDIDRDMLTDAIAKREFFAEFQPKIDLRTGEMVGAEALARWRSAAFGRIAPSVFIPLVERHGLMADFTRLILDSAVSRTRDFLEVDPRFALAVNVPGVLLDDLSLPDQIEDILRAHDAPPQALVVEVTEDFAMSNVSRALDILVRLRIKGVGAAIDDFGTGYSSLAALARMPFSELKIDQSFV